MNLHYSNDNETKFCEIAYLVSYLSCKDESLKNTWLTSEVFAYSKPMWKNGFSTFQITRLWIVITDYYPQICSKWKSSKYIPLIQLSHFWMIQRRKVPENLILDTWSFTTIVDPYKNVIFLNPRAHFI